METYIKHTLDGQWSLSFTDPDTNQTVTTSVTVPCNVEPTLQKLGLVADYMPADDEFATEKFQWVDDWTYRTHFDCPPLPDGFTRELVFEGIDTIAEIYLNGKLVCQAANMHRSYRIPVTDAWRDHENELTVVIRSSELWARDHCHDLFSMTARDSTYYDSNAYLRKARHQWGWDNAPRLLTSGIIRSVYLEDIPPRRFEDVYLYTVTVNQTNVEFGAAWKYVTDQRSTADHTVRFTLLDGETAVHTETRRLKFIQGNIRCTLPRERIELWWPTGFGKAKLYTAKLEMLVGDQVVADYTSPFGIRTVFLERTEEIEADGTGNFLFRVNGTPLHARGANWKPLSPLASEAHALTLAGKGLDELTALHCNMVRIWGGGIYEDHPFFDYCDRNGILVWQDFMFACEIPPHDEEFCREVSAEATEIVKKLRNHPSLAIWCGDNENDSFFEHPKRFTDALPSDNLLTRKVLKQVILHHDPHRAYVESSPVVSDKVKKSMVSDPTRYGMPELHLYVEASRFANALRNTKSFFIGETGPICTNAATVNDRIFAREKARCERLWNAPFVTRLDPHQNDDYFITWRVFGKKLCEDRYGRDFSFAEWKDFVIALNVGCAEIFKDVIEYSRVSRWKKTGVLWWSLMDMWPMQFNYSVIDCDGHRKLPYYWIRQSQQEIALMAVRTEIDGELALYAVNDTLVDQKPEYTVTAYDENGNAKTIASGICNAKANSSVLIQRIAEDDSPSMWLIDWTVNGGTGFNHVFTKPKVSYETMLNWVKIYDNRLSKKDKLLELQ